MATKTEAVDAVRKLLAVVESMNKPRRAGDMVAWLDQVKEAIDAGNRVLLDAAAEDDWYRRGDEGRHE